MRRKLVVLITCHNRKEKTLRCLKSLFNSVSFSSADVDVVLVDDGSTDGTYNAVSEQFPTVKIICGNGSLFWNRGMHTAFEEGLKIPCEFFLLLNDDTLLEVDGINRLLDTWKVVHDRTGEDGIIVGSTRDERAGITTYGGVCRPSKWKRTTFVLMEPGDEPKACEAMNCNCVLLPRSIALHVGNLDPHYAHSMGDFDYALRAAKAGYNTWIAPGHVGSCSKNNSEGTFLDCSLPFLVRWKKMMAPKGLPPRSWFIFTRKHAGPVWPLYFLWPYMWLLGSSLSRTSRAPAKTAR